MTLRGPIRPSFNLYRSSFERAGAKGEDGERGERHDSCEYGDSVRISLRLFYRTGSSFPLVLVVYEKTCSVFRTIYCYFFHIFFVGTQKIRI